MMNNKSILSQCFKAILYPLVVVLLSFTNLLGQIPLGVDVNIFPPYPTQYNVWIADASNYMITIVMQIIFVIICLEN